MICLALSPLLFHFCFILPLFVDRDFWAVPSWVYPSRFSPARSFLRSHSNSFLLALSPPIPIIFINLNNGATAFSTPSMSANHLLSIWGCHLIPSFSSSRTSFLLWFLHLRHQVYRCSTVFLPRGCGQAVPSGSTCPGSPTSIYPGSAFFFRHLQPLTKLAVY